MVTMGDLALCKTRHDIERNPMIFNLFRKNTATEPVYAVYNAIVAQSRQSRFYADWLVPDTVTGRFDMISLHMALLFRRLRAGDGSQKKFLGLDLGNMLMAAGLPAQPTLFGLGAVALFCLAALGLVPFIVVWSDRAGVSISAFWKSDGVEPGTRSSRLW